MDLCEGETMRRLLCVAAIVDVLVMGCGADGQSRSPILLPQDQTVAVITLDFRGGYGPARKDDRPLLTIFANGVIRIVDSSSEVAPIEAKISADALQDLLRFAIDEHLFLILITQRRLSSCEPKKTSLV